MRGIQIKLKQKVQSGVDDFNYPVYTDTWVDIDNVLIGEPTTDDITETFNLTGKQLAYVLAIPKGDTHVWENTQVRFWGKTFRTIGYPTQGIDALIPLDWNKKVRVEHYG